MRNFPLNLLLAMVVALTTQSARAEELSSAPGWALNKITEAQKAEENTYQEAKVYFSLKPPDARPAITVDARTADRLRSGEVYPEVAYAGQQAGKKDEKKEDDEFVYGKHGNGIVIAEPVSSTLTEEEGRKETIASAANSAPPPARSLKSSTSSSFTGFSNSGLSSSSSHATAQQAIAAAGARNTSGASGDPRANSTGASSPPPGQTPEPPKHEDPRVIASADNKPPPDAGKPIGLQASGVTVNNAAAGFGVPLPKDKNSKGKEDPKDFVVWPNGDPTDPKTIEANKAKCAQSVAKTFDSPRIERFSIPAGCSSVRVRAWGAGGGAGDMQDNGSITGGDGGGGAYVYAEGRIDTYKYDLIVVVGGPGGDGRPGKPGAAGFPGGGKGGASSGRTGGGGGGYSGLFLVEKGKDYGGNPTPLYMELSIMMAAGGGGGSPTGERGGEGGIEKGGGDNGASSSKAGPAGGNGKAGNAQIGGDGGESKAGVASGGGGGGGFFGGGGGGGTEVEDGIAGAGGGGSSFSRFLDNMEARKGEGSQAGNYNFKPRGKAGNAGKAGLVIVEFF